VAGDEVAHMQYEVRLEQQAARLLAVVRRRATIPELPRVVPEACGFVWNILRTNKVTGAGRHIAVYWDDQINLEVGVEMTSPFAGCGEVVASMTPAGTVATTTHFGPYQQLHAAHEAIRQWCTTSGHTLAGPNWEIYDHWKDEWNRDPSQIRTDVFYLLSAP
jgi:effector-binding domain-containing protein